MSTKIALIGEAWGEDEAQYKRPFIGKAGQELNRMLLDAGLLREECFVTNVFNVHPPGNNLKFFLGKRNEADVITRLPAIEPGYYLQTKYKEELDRLLNELEQVRPNVAVLLGNTACWALLQSTRISKIRGAACISPVLPWLKCIPTYHPAAVLRQYELRHVTVLDLAKVKLESNFPELRRPVRRIYLDPSLADIRTFLESRARSCKRMAVDIETASGKITCIGFAPSIEEALVIPFFDPRKSNGLYWNSIEEELAAWNLVQELLSLPCEKVFQNGLYDMQYMWQYYGLTTFNAAHDTMLCHHSLQPESPKALDFLGSVYTNEVAWKTLRPRGKHTIKRED